MADHPIATISDADAVRRYAEGDRIIGRDGEVRRDLIPIRGGFIALEKGDGRQPDRVAIAQATYNGVREWRLRVGDLRYIAARVERAAPEDWPVYGPEG
jgi:hypothetical protein